MSEMTPDEQEIFDSLKNAIFGGGVDLRTATDWERGFEGTDEGGQRKVLTMFLEAAKGSRSHLEIIEDNLIVRLENMPVDMLREIGLWLIQWSVKREKDVSESN